MRIVGGEYRGKALSSPEGLKTRPTSDRARQAIFNILEHGGWCPRPLPDDARVLDVFAGTGAMGLEALSRGAASAVFIENNRAAQQACRQNIAAIKAAARATLQSFDALHPPSLSAGLVPCDLVFLDPPYGQNLGSTALEALDAQGWIAAGAVVVMEMAKKQPEPLPEHFTLADTRHYGVAEVRFLLRD